jgi:geranylgeranyl diphosphate synthase, type I
MTTTRAATAAAAGLDTTVLLHDAIRGRWSAGTDSLDTMCRYALEAPGKLFRPALLLESAQAVGGRAEAVVMAAAGTESGHVASLIHDDIIDGDDIRRGRAAVHRRFGMEAAIVAGDAMIFDLFVCLAECRGAVPDDRIVAAFEIVAQAGVELCRGQTLEADITEGRLLDADLYLRMISMKTAALFRGACQSGAVLGGAPPEWASMLAEYGEHLGIAFQVRDDLLGYLADDAVTGKPAISDIKNRRLTLPVIYAYRDGTPYDRSILDIALRGDMPHEEALPAMTDVLRRTGAIAGCTALAVDHASAACRALTALPQSPSRDRLASYAARAVERTG